MKRLRFRPITAESLDELRQYSARCDSRVSDYSLANLYGWQPYFNTCYATHDGIVAIRYTSPQGIGYMRPLTSETTDCESVMTLIEQLRSEAFASGSGFTIYGLREEEAQQLQQQHPHMDITPMRDSGGYLYLRERLASLAGRKLQAKRNHINKFRSLYPDYEYRPLDASLTAACYAFARRWAEKHVQQFPDQMSSAVAELNAMRRCFANWENMPLIGGTLWVEGQMVAFTYGCPISTDTIDVCIEKADIAYEGAYTVINQLFAQHLPEQYTYLNREEDLGVEGLRKAKLSYHPEDILVRYLCSESCPRLSDEREQMHTLWQQTFADPEPFADLYFSKVYTPNNSICGTADGRITAALQLLPYTLKLRSACTPAAYISGTMVAADHRGHGIGRQLMQAAHIKAYSEGCTFVMLIASSEKTSQWYRQMGYADKALCHAAPEDIEKTTFDEFDRWQNAQQFLLLHNATDYAIALEDIRRLGTSSYRDTLPAMLRIVNAYEALHLFATEHPAITDTITITGDDDLPANNATYSIARGEVHQIIEPTAESHTLHISQLPAYLLQDNDISMMLMLER
ncbi:MAG: GNAT family N-acetyltransferase [Bacteroidales bacterium]|nr:GNAT family N-acetyltransferase [Bacteroidales bacterium]